MKYHLITVIYIYKLVLNLQMMNSISHQNKWFLTRIILDMPHNDAKLKSKKNSRRLVNHQQVSEKQPLCEGLILILSKGSLASEF